MMLAVILVAYLWWWLSFW